MCVWMRIRCNAGNENLVQSDLFLLPRVLENCFLVKMNCCMCTRVGLGEGRRAGDEVMYVYVLYLHMLYLIYVVYVCLCVKLVSTDVFQKTISSVLFITSSPLQ